MFNIANTTLQGFKDARGLIYSLAYEALPSSITSRAASSGSNILGLDPTAGPLVLALQTVQWANAADDEVINAAVRSIWSQADAIAQRRNLMNRWIYLNYAAQDQDVIGSYGWVNKDKLQKASRKYDPTGIFQKNVPGGWKLFM